MLLTPDGEVLFEHIAPAISQYVLQYPEVDVCIRFGEPDLRASVPN